LNSSPGKQSHAAAPYRIPFNRPCFQGRELEYIAEVIRVGRISGDGEYTRRCQELLEGLLGAPKIILTTSCTDALEMAALLLDIGPGDEVIVPSFTFVSTANAFALRGARIVFADVRRDTLNMDEGQLPALIGPRTRAIVPVHYAGVGCSMERICELATANGATAVIEDNAHGLFGRHRGRLLGTFGDLATLSFHETKNITCGEGGALVVNRPELIERAEVLRDKGTNRSRFFRGEVDKYTWVELGSSFLPSDLLAAFLLAQLEERERIQAKRAAVWQTYSIQLREWAGRNGVTLPVVPADCAQSFHMFYLLMPGTGERDALIAHLKTRGILAVFHYTPLHLSPMGESHGGKAGGCPVAEDIAARIVRLPFFNDFSEPEQAQVVAAVRDFGA
jgi:dTDP-4-amino-4,6-dideoxygalactose transaminase